MGIVPEDIPCPVAIVVLVWASLQQNEKKKGKRLSLKVSKMVRRLIRYNLCLGTFEMGVLYHDVSRNIYRNHMMIEKFILDMIVVLHAFRSCVTLPAALLETQGICEVANVRSRQH
jgi:hypothetical protein